MKKNYLKSFLLIACLLGSIMASAYSFKIDGICYDITSSADQTVAVTSNGDNSYSGTVVIPETVTNGGKDYLVTSIGHLAFIDCKGLTSVTIPNSVKSIGIGAFRGTGLISVAIGNSVISIDDHAFSGCTGLTGITIPNSVTKIGRSAFYGCTGLKSIEIPNSVTRIGGKIFSDCTGLTSVTIPNSLISIGEYAFENCTGLTSVTIPNSVTEIGDGAFNACIGLTNVTIGDSVISIGSQAFRDCTGLTSVTIPNSVTSIGYSPFYGCTGLRKIYDYSETPQAAAQFYNKVDTKKCMLYVPTGSKLAYSNAEGWKAFMTIKGIGEPEDPETPEDEISDYFEIDGIYYHVTSSTTVEVTSGKNKYIGKIDIPESVKAYSVTAIDNLAFFGCDGLTDVTIPNSVIFIGGSTFQVCTGLTSVTIGNSVALIGDEAFDGCINLTKFVVDPENSNYSAPDGVLFNKDQTILMVYPNAKGSSYTIPNTVTFIRRYAFYGCDDLTGITIPKSVTVIGDYAFSYCKGLKEVINYSETPQSIPADMFNKVEQGTGTLYVPKGSKSSYETDAEWGKFQIKEM